MKMCKKELFQFILQIIFGSIFDIYHGTLILCCTTTDLGIFSDFGCCSRDFGSCICESSAGLIFSDFKLG